MLGREGENQSLNPEHTEVDASEDQMGRLFRVRTHNQNDRDEMDGFEEVGCELPPFRAILLRNGALHDRAPDAPAPKRRE